MAQLNYPGNLALETFCPGHLVKVTRAEGENAKLVGHLLLILKKLYLPDARVTVWEVELNQLVNRGSFPYRLVTQIVIDIGMGSVLCDFVGVIDRNEGGGTDLFALSD